MGLAVQGGSGTTRHLDGMLEVLRDAHGQRPRLVHRLDKDTAGCLLVAKTRFAASALAKTFRSRSARKVYWALVAGVPKVPQGRISTFLAKEEREDESFMRIAQHGDKGASHAVTYYAVVDTSGPLLVVDFAQAGDRPHPSIARAYGSYRPSDRRRSEIFCARELGAARRHAEQAASSGAPHRGAASARRRDRRHRAAAAAYAAVLEPARASTPSATIRSSTRRRSDARGTTGPLRGSMICRVANNEARRGAFGLSLICGLALVIAASAAAQARDIEMGGDSNYPYSIMAPEPGDRPSSRGGVGAIAAHQVAQRARNLLAARPPRTSSSRGARLVRRGAADTVAENAAHSAGRRQRADHSPRRRRSRGRPCCRA